MSSPSEDQEPNAEKTASLRKKLAALGLDIPEGTNIVLRGEPLLCLRPELNNASVPSEFRHQALVRDRYFFTLPELLLDDLIREIGSEKFEPGAIELERTLSHICRELSAQVGFWRGQALSYGYLREATPQSFKREEVEELNWEKNQAKLDLAARTASPWLITNSNSTRGYLGWLLTHPNFLAEHDALVTTHASTIACWGINLLGLEASPLGFERATAEQKTAYHTASEVAFEFLQRWRLQYLAAPYLPVPLQPQLSGEQPPLRQYEQAAGRFQIPDTCPLPSRDEFHQALENVRRNGTPEHLQEWGQIVAADNTAKQEMGRFARHFEVQHYCRVFAHRHPSANHRTLGKIKQSLANFLGVDSRTIDSDMQAIGHRLGKDWRMRPANWPFGPF